MNQPLPKESSINFSCVRKFCLLILILLINTLAHKKDHCGGGIQKVPLTHSLTKAVLSVVAHAFSFGPRFCKFFTEEWSLFYIRTHYFSFIKLYNKGYRTEDQTEYKLATNLCKLHLKCLFNIAKNRNQETSHNFYKLRVVEFLTREIDLEYSVSTRGNMVREANAPTAPQQNEVELPPKEKPSTTSNNNNQVSKPPDDDSDQDSPAPLPPPKSVPKFDKKKLKLDITKVCDKNLSSCQGMILDPGPTVSGAPEPMYKGKIDEGKEEAGKAENKEQANASKNATNNEPSASNAASPQNPAPALPPSSSASSSSRAPLPPPENKMPPQETKKPPLPQAKIPNLKLDLAKVNKSTISETSQKGANDKESSKRKEGEAAKTANTGQLKKNILAEIKRKKVSKEEEKAPPVQTTSSVSLPPSDKPPMNKSGPSGEQRTTTNNISLALNNKLALDLKKLHEYQAKKGTTSEENQAKVPLQPSKQPQQPAPKEEKKAKTAKTPHTPAPLIPKPGEGTIVGSNRVYVPSLKLPTNIDCYKDDAEEAIKHEKPKGERFQLKRAQNAGELNKTFSTGGGEGNDQAPNKKRASLFTSSTANAKPVLGLQEPKSKDSTTLVAQAQRNKLAEKDLLKKEKKEEKDASGLMRNNEEEKKQKRPEHKKVPKINIDAVSKRDPDRAYKEKQEIVSAYGVEQKQNNKKESNRSEGGQVKIEKPVGQNKPKWQAAVDPSQRSAMSQILAGGVTPLVSAAAIGGNNGNPGATKEEKTGMLITDIPPELVISKIKVILIK